MTVEFLHPRQPRDATILPLRRPRPGKQPGRPTNRQLQAKVKQLAPRDRRHEVDRRPNQQLSLLHQPSEGARARPSRYVARKGQILHFDRGAELISIPLFLFGGTARLVGHRIPAIENLGVAGVSTLCYGPALPPRWEPPRLTGRPIDSRKMP